MKTLRAPQIVVDKSLSYRAKTEQLRLKGLRAEINELNWPVEYPKKMPVAVTLAHDGERLYLYYEVKREKIRAVNTRDFSSVWEDSCVEFFVQREGEAAYRNFEANPLGALLAAVREKRDAAVQLKADMPFIVRQSTIEHYYEDGKELSDWTLYLEIPKQALGFAADESLSGQKLRANFYKCGDSTVEPHFLSWNPIEAPQPNFHLPRFFGSLELQ
ncbi:MAG: hypothetical protein LBR48_05385 [Dysgonamonadaceae bacterium]|nr:hypothetical protein [Dysgonamonadaceae bacterium]